MTHDKNIWIIWI